MVRRYSRSRDATVHSSGMRRSNETHSTRSTKKSGRKGGRSGRYKSSVGRDEYAEDFRYERERSSSTRRGSTGSRHRSTGSRYGSRGSRERYSSGRTRREYREDYTRRHSRAYESDSRDPSDSSTVSYWEVDEYRDIPLEKKDGFFGGIFNLGDDEAYSSDFSDGTSEQSSASEIVPYRPPSPRHKTGRKVGRPSTERRLVKSQPKFRREEEQASSGDNSADAVDLGTTCQIVMYDTLLMWKDPLPTTKLIEGPKEGSFSQVLKDSLLWWKTPHSPHRHLRIEDTQGRSYESDSCSSARYSHISTAHASTKGPSKSACRNALEQLQKKQTEALQLNDHDDESFKLLGKRIRSVSSLGENESMVSAITDYPFTSEEGNHNAIEESFILEKPFTTLPVPGSLGFDMSKQGLQVTAPPMATSFAPLIPEDHAQAVGSAFMQDREMVVQDKIAEIMMKKNLYNEGLSDTTGMILSPEATAFLDNRAAGNSGVIEDPTLNQLAAELDSLRALLSPSENIAVSNFIQILGEGADIDETNILISTSHASDIDTDKEAKVICATKDTSFVGKKTALSHDSPSPNQDETVTQLPTVHNEVSLDDGNFEKESNQRRQDDEIVHLSDITASTTSQMPSSSVAAELKECQGVESSLAEIPEEHPVKTPQEDRKQRLAALMSKLFNMSHTRDDDEITHVSNEALSDAGSLSSRHDDVNSRSDIAVTGQNSFAPTIETAMSLISFATVDPTLASIIEEPQWPIENEEMHPASNLIKSCNTKEEYTVAPALEAAPSSISLGPLDYNLSLLSWVTTDAAPSTIEAGEGQKHSSSTKTSDKLYEKEDQNLSLPELTKSSQLSALVTPATKSSSAVSSIAKTRTGSLRPSMAGTVKSILKALVAGDEPDLDIVRVLIVKSKAPKLSQEEIMAEAMSWSAKGKADPINVLLKDMELYVVHEKVHYGELSSAGLFLNKSSEVIRGIIGERQRSSKSLQIADPELCSDAHKASIIPEATQSAICRSNNETTQCTAGNNVGRQVCSSSKPSEDVPPTLSQEPSAASDLLGTNTLLAEQGGVKVNALGPDKRLPKAPLPRSEEASVADSSSQSISLDDAVPNVRLPKPPSPESEAARFVVTKQKAMTKETSKVEIPPPSVQTEKPEITSKKIDAQDSKVTQVGTTSIETKKTRSNLREDRVPAPLPWDVKIRKQTAGNDQMGTDSVPPKEHEPIALSNVVMKLKATQLKTYPKVKAVTPSASIETVLNESKPVSSRGSTSLEAAVMKLKMATGAALAREIMRKQTSRK